MINIINNFTCEPGVRKLKEILFEIIGKINLKLLNNDFDVLWKYLWGTNITNQYKNEEAYKEAVANLASLIKFETLSELNQNLSEINDVDKIMNILKTNKF